MPHPRAAPHTPHRNSQPPPEPRPRSHPQRRAAVSPGLDDARWRSLLDQHARRSAAPLVRRRRSDGRRSARRRRGPATSAGHRRAASGDTATSAERRPARSSRSAPTTRGPPHPHPPTASPCPNPVPGATRNGERPAHRVSTTLAGARCSTSSTRAGVPRRTARRQRSGGRRPARRRRRGAAADLGTSQQRPATRQRVPNDVRRAAAAVPHHARPPAPPPTNSQPLPEPRPGATHNGKRSAHRVSATLAGARCSTSETPQTLAGPDGIGACQPRQTASSRHTRQTSAPATVVTRPGQSARTPTTATAAPASAGVA